MNESFYANLDDLNAALENILTGVTASTVDTEVLRRAFSDTILDALSQSDIDWSQVDMYAFVDQALNNYRGPLKRHLQSGIAAGVRNAIHRTAIFYESIGLDLSLDDLGVLVQRSEMAEQLSYHFEHSYGLSNRKLRDSTVAVMQEAIGLGNIDLNYIRNEILRRSVTSEHHAATQAQTSVAAFNQHYRNTLADEAGLEYYLYTGTIVAGTRPFCRAHLGNAYHKDVIAQMNNGQLNPVQIFKGGYNCRHSLLAVDPEWLDSDSKIFGRDAQVSNYGGNGEVVAVDEAGLGRLKRQDELLRGVKEGPVNSRGKQAMHYYRTFWNAPDSDGGFVYADETWLKARGIDGKNLEALDAELDFAKTMARLGHEVGLNQSVFDAYKKAGSNKIDYDARVGNDYVQVKTPKRNRTSVFSDMLTSRQSLVHYVRLTSPVDPEMYPEMIKNGQGWLRQNPTRSLFVLHDYDDVLFIEEVVNNE